MKSRALVAVATAAAIALTAAPAGATTMNVNTLEDGFDADGKCALREAVEASRKNKKEDGCPKGSTSRDTIKLKDQTYQLSFITTNENVNVNGDLDFTGGGPVTLLGKGKGKTDILQNAGDRIVDVHGAGNLNVERLRLGSGDVSALGASEGRGGDARVTGGRLAIKNSVVNSSDAYVGGGVYASGNSGKLSLSNVEMGSTEAVVGGAIGVQSGATATITRTTVSNVGVDSATESTRGAILSNDGGELVKVIESTFQGSTASAAGVGHAASGGAIYSNGDLLVLRSLIQGNNTTAAQDNTAEHGGALYLASGDVSIVNSTIFNNQAGGPGDNDGLGGGIYSSIANVDVDLSTFDSNSGTSAGDAVATVAGSTELLGSLIDDSPDPCFGDDVASDGYNVSEDDDAGGDCGFIASDVRDVSTGTGSVADNGGPTLTIAINSASPARDRVPKNLCKPATSRVDQRGFERPRGDKCDSGAFEFNAKAP